MYAHTPLVLASLVFAFLGMAWFFIKDKIIKIMFFFLSFGTAIETITALLEYDVEANVEAALAGYFVAVIGVFGSLICYLLIFMFLIAMNAWEEKKEKMFD